MTQVDFHFNAPEKLPYVCRLLRKAAGQGRKVGVVPAVFAQAVITPVHVAPFDFRLAFELLDEVAMPIQAADETRKPGAVPTGLRGQGIERSAGALHHFAQADTAPGQVGRNARTGRGRRQRRGDATPVAQRPRIQKTVQGLKPQAAATALTLGGVVLQAKGCAHAFGAMAFRWRKELQRGHDR